MSPHQALQHTSPAAGSGAPRAFGSEGRQGLITGLHRIDRNRGFPLKEHTQNPMCTGTKHKSSNLLGAWAALSASLGGSSGEAGQGEDSSSSSS